MLSGAKFIYKIAAVRELERIAIEEYHIDVDTLMQRAGQAAFRELQRLYPSCKQLCVVCGKGNNAGDGYVLALAAQRAGLQVTVLYLVAPDQLHGPAARAAALCVAEKVKLSPYTPEQLLTSAQVIVDAILGTGLVGEVSAPFRQAIHEINAAKLPILALDIPSGLDADRGKVLGAAIKADVTVTFLGNKIGFYLGEGPNYTGQILFDDLAVPAAIYSLVAAEISLLNFAENKAQLAKRPRQASKIDFGYVLIIGGNYGMAGAVRMAGEAALRVGAGMVNVITLWCHVSIINSVRPELMCRGFTWWNIFSNRIESLLARATVIVLGPGLGKTWWSKILFNLVAKQTKPCVGAPRKRHSASSCKCCRENADPAYFVSNLGQIAAMQ